MTPNPQDSAVALAVEREAIDQQVRQIYVSQGPRGLMQLCIQLLAEKSSASQSDGTSGVPDGWKLVPVEPTVEMLSAGAECWHISKDNADGYYRAMLAAAPTQGENHVG